MAIQVTSNQELSSLILNRVDSKETFAAMLANNQVNADELYLIQSELEESHETFSVEFTDNGNNIIANKSYSEISTAINDGYVISAIFKENNSTTELIYLKVNSDNSIIFYSPVYLNNNEPEVFYIIYNSNGTIVTNSFSLSVATPATLTIGPYTYNGTTAVTIPVYDGSYTWAQGIS